MTEALLEEGQELEVSAASHAPRFVDVSADELEADPFQIELSNVGSLTVKVVDAGGREIDGIRVDYRSISRGAPTHLVFGTLTDKLPAPVTRDGHVEISNLPAGTYRLLFKREGRDLGSIDVPLEAGDSRRVEFTLPEDHTLRGVVTLDGRPLSGGVVRCESEEVEVNPDGSFTLTVTRRRPRVLRYWPPYQEENEPWVWRCEFIDEGSVSLAFESASLRATIQGPDGEPWGQLPGKLLGPSTVEFVSDNDGWVVIDTMLAGEYRWSIKPTENAYAPADPFRVQGDTVTQYRLSRARVVEIRVRQPEVQEGWVVSVDGLKTNGRRCRIPRIGPDRYVIPDELRFVRAYSSVSAPVVLDLLSEPAGAYRADLGKPGGRMTISAPKPLRVTIEPLGSVVLHPLQRRMDLGERRIREPLPVGLYRVTPEGREDDAIEVQVTEGGDTRVELP